MGKIQKFSFAQRREGVGLESSRGPDTMELFDSGVPLPVGDNGSVGVVGVPYLLGLPACQLARKCILARVCSTYPWRAKNHHTTSPEARVVVHLSCRRSA